MVNFSKGTKTQIGEIVNYLNVNVTINTLIVIHKHSPCHVIPLKWLLLIILKISLGKCRMINNSGEKSKTNKKTFWKHSTRCHHLSLARARADCILLELKLNLRGSF